MGADIKLLPGKLLVNVSRFQSPRLALLSHLALFCSSPIPCIQHILFLSQAFSNPERSTHFDLGLSHLSYHNIHRDVYCCFFSNNLQLLKPTGWLFCPIRCKTTLPRFQRKWMSRMLEYSRAEIWPFWREPVSMYERTWTAHLQGEGAG